MTDAFTVVVSEETGAISCTKNGELFRDIDEDRLSELLLKNLTQTMKTPDVNPLNWRGRKNG